MLQPILVGYGRAGKRHDKLLQARGYLPAIVEPNIEQLDTVQGYDLVTGTEISEQGEKKGFGGILRKSSRRHFFALTSALSADQWAFAVICTPPDQHLQQIEMCHDNNLVVLCEKPLCGFGQLDQARKHMGTTHITMVAYNYRFNPDLQAYKVGQIDPQRGVRIFSSVYRDAQPSWGYTLDHVAHALDNLIWKFGRLTVETARTTETPTKYLTLVYGSFVQGGWFKIHEEVRKSPCDRVVWMGDDRVQVPITANPLMFENMWDHFLEALEKGESFYPGPQEALETQEALEDIHYYAEADTFRKSNSGERWPQDH